LSTRYFIWEDPDRLVKVVDGVGYILRDGAWHQSEPAYRRASGIGGDADCREIDSIQGKRIEARELRPAERKP